MRLSIGGVPLHPALVHFPVVLWVFAPLADAGYLLGFGDSWWRAGFLLAAAGVVLAVPAIIAGAFDAVNNMKNKDAADTLWRHIMMMFTAWALFGLSLPLSGQGAAPTTVELILGTGLHLSGAVLMAVGAHAGGRLIHVYGLPKAAKSDD